MPTGRKKRCPNAGCRANSGQVRRAFSADKTKCPYCGSQLIFVNPPRAVAKGGAKGGGKRLGGKIASFGLNGPTLGRKLRKKKQSKRWNILKDSPRKETGRKR